MAGSGELEQELRAFCTEHALDNVVFTGFVNQSELPALYAASDVFVLPSEHEPWGLAVNEAMCAGLPVVVSREVGCVADLVRDGVNGYTPAAGDIEGLARALRRLIEDEGLRRRQGQASLARILQWGYQQCLEGIRSALGGFEMSRLRSHTDVADERHLNRRKTPFMCGIAGIYAYHYAANAVDRAELRRIRDHMAARGPDGLGEWYSQDERVGFGHRRLTIIDLSERGAQPMMSADGKLVVTFNGEIYNYRQLRASLEARGCVFRTQTDTEVLLHLYAEKGEAMVNDLRGMFAFGLWDAEKNALLLARDPYGIKPLYYADDGWTLRFASQVKALLAGGKVSRNPEPAGWVGFCLFGSVPEPFTTYQEIRALPAGSTLWVDRVGTRETKQYFSIADTYCRAEAATLARKRRRSAARRPGGAPRQRASSSRGRCPGWRIPFQRNRLRRLVGLMRDAGTAGYPDGDPGIRGISR